MYSSETPEKVEIDCIFKAQNKQASGIFLLHWFFRPQAFGFFFTADGAFFKLIASGFCLTAGAFFFSYRWLFFLLAIFFFDWMYIWRRIF